MTCKQAISVLIIAFALVGCGAGPQPTADAEINKATDNAKVVRAIYDAAGGDFEKVPDGDKKKLIEIYKDEAGAKKAFDLIKNPPGGLPGAPPMGQPR